MGLTEKSAVQNGALVFVTQVYRPVSAVGESPALGIRRRVGRVIHPPLI